MRISGNLTLASLLLGIAACDDTSSVSTPVEDHEHEAITSVILRVVDSANAADSATVRFVDSDGEGGAAPKLPDTLRLRPGRTYKATVQFLDESNPSDIHDLNEEIGGSESDDHLVLWIPSSGVLATTVTDRDSKGLLLGLAARLRTTTSGKASLRVNLRHLPGIKTAGSGLADGETDADVAFPVSIASP